MKLTTDGLVINEWVTGETTRIICVLTRDNGVIRAFAHGARGIKSKNAAATDLLCYSSFTFNRSRDTYSVSEAAVKELFFNLRGDIEKLSLAQYFCELAYTVVPENVSSEAYLRILLNSLHFLSEGTRDARLIKAITELRLISVAGFAPDLLACRVCGRFESDVMCFDTVEGQLCCEECLSGAGGGTVRIGSGVLAAMRHIIYSDFEKLYSFALPEKLCEELSDVCERYVLNKTERRYNSLDFYHSLFSN